MSNETNETIADIVADIRAQNQGLPEGSYALSPLVCDLLSLADRIIAAHNREIDELKTQIKIAKDAFFNISMCDHSQKIHDIFCEAEFMMNHPEMREVQNEQEQH